LPFLKSSVNLFLIILPEAQYIIMKLFITKIVAYSRKARPAYVSDMPVSKVSAKISKIYSS